MLQCICSSLAQTILANTGFYFILFIFIGLRTPKSLALLIDGIDSGQKSRNNIISRFLNNLVFI